MINLPKKVSERLSRELGRFQRILQNAKARDVNEADTVTIVTDILSGVFGYDKYTEITGEHAIRGTYCDIAIRINEIIRYLIEVKAIGIELKDSHLRQAINYGANNGIQWILLTNGITWNAYRLKFEKPISYELLFSLNFLELNARKQEDQDRLFLLCREGLEKAAIEEFHKYISNVNKFIISAIIQDIPAINVIRRELRKISPGLKIERDEIERILINEVFKRDVLESEQFKDAKARLKKYLKKRRATADSNKCEVNLNSESESPDQAELTEQMKAEGSAFDIGQL